MAADGVVEKFPRRHTSEPGSVAYLESFLVLIGLVTDDVVVLVKDALHPGVPLEDLAVHADLTRRERHVVDEEHQAVAACAELVLEHRHLLGFDLWRWRVKVIGMMSEWELTARQLVSLQGAVRSGSFKKVF